MQLMEPLFFGTYNNVPLEWMPLDANKGTHLLISKYIIDFKKFQSDKKGITWKTSEIRKWLNNDFFAGAFTKQEQGSILLSEIYTGDNVSYHHKIEGCGVTQDRIFLLSLEEAERYFARHAQRTAACQKHGTEKRDWLLRSPGLNVQRFAYVSRAGWVIDRGFYQFRRGGIRPALWKKEKEIESIAFGRYGGLPLEWIVLAANSKGEKLLLLNNIMARMPYHVQDEDVTWETCSLRKWLNNHFYAEAFSSSEQKKIASVSLQNDDNESYGIPGGNDTEDKVFLLSLQEAEEYLNTPPAGRAAEGNGKQLAWWLRSPGVLSKRGAYVSKGGYIIDRGLAAQMGIGIRPALWLK